MDRRNPYPHVILNSRIKAFGTVLKFILPLPFGPIFVKPVPQNPINIFQYKPNGSGHSPKVCVNAIA